MTFFGLNYNRTPKVYQNKPKGIEKVYLQNANILQLKKLHFSVEMTGHSIDYGHIDPFYIHFFSTILS